MSSCSRQFVVEAVEPRRYAASAEKIVTVVNDPKQSTTVLKYTYGQTVDLAKLPRVRVTVDAAKTVNVQGKGGDDSVRVRVVRGGLEIRTNTRWSYSYWPVGQPVPLNATTTIENVYKFSPKEFTTLTINGGKGDDSLRYSGGLPFNLPVESVETLTRQTYPEAPKGRTPSDALARPGNWLKRVADEKAKADTGTVRDVAMFGDSHAAGFLGVGYSSWRFKLRKPAVFGIGGDTTGNVLYRIRNGLFDKYKPAKLIVSVGTNNFNDPQTGGTGEQIFQGVLKVMAELRKRLPDSRLVLISLLPRNGAGLNERVKALNDRLDAANESSGFEFVNLYDRFSNRTKKFNAFTDLRVTINPFGNDSHYTSTGYGILGDTLARLLELGPYSK